MPREVHAPQRPPHAVWSVTDGTRALGELAWYASSARWLARRPLTGAGRPVVVLPGFMAGDWSTAPLRRLLGNHGFVPYGWGQGRNVGPTEQAVAGLDALFREIRGRHSGPISVIGQSLGGIFGLELARRFPDDVDRLISLGSPVSIRTPSQSRAKRTYQYYADRHVPELEFHTWLSAPLPDVRSTSIFSRIDGVCRWEACLYSEDPQRENIEVISSHLGMAVQPPAVYATLDRLTTPLDDWKPFAPPRFLRSAYPGLGNPIHLAPQSLVPAV